MNRDLFYLTKKEWNVFIISGICFIIIIMVIAILTFYVPQTKNGTIMSDKKPILFHLKGICLDSEDNIYLHCENTTFCYNADMKFLCSYSWNQNGSTGFDIQNDQLLFDRGDDLIRAFSRDGIFIRSFESNSKLKNKTMISLSTGRNIKLQKNILIYKLIDDQDIVLWHSFNIFGFLIIILFLTVLLLLILLTKGKIIGRKKRKFFWEHT